MKRILSGLAVTVLIVAGVGAAIIWLSSRDGGSLDHSAAPTPAAAAPDGGCTRTGNVVIKYSAEPDAIRIDQLAERLGAIDTEPARASGQAIIAKEKADLVGVVAVTSCQDEASFPSATDSGLESFVREYLGNKETATP